LKLSLKLFRITKRGVVILIDEYDSPITNLLSKILLTKSYIDLSDYSQIPEVQEIIEFLRNFFSSIKSLRARKSVRFEYITGIVPIVQIGLFSGANDIFQVRQDRVYDELIGFTLKEIKHIYGDNLIKIAKHLLMNRREQDAKKQAANDEKISIEQKDVDKMVSEIYRNLEYHYNGFIFHNQQEQPLYSPFSINSFFQNSKSNIIDKKNKNLLYLPYFAESGTSKLIWRALSNLNTVKRTTFFWGLQSSEKDDVENIIFPTQDPSDFSTNQTLNELFDKPERLAYFNGYLKVLREVSDDKGWELAIVNHEMKRAFLGELQAQSGLKDSAIHLFGGLSNEKWSDYWRLVNEQMDKLSALFKTSSEIGKASLETETYGTTAFNLIHFSINNIIIPGRSTEAISEFNLFSNKKVSDGPRPDAIIRFRATDGKLKALIIEFKCKDDIGVAIKEAEKCLRNKYVDIIEEKLKEDYKDLADCTEKIYAAVALSYGKIGRVEMYKKKGSSKEMEEKPFETWPLDK